MVSDSLRRPPPFPITIARIEDPTVIKPILDHLARRAGLSPAAFRLLARAPPQGELSGLEDQ